MIHYVCSWCGRDCGSKPAPDGVDMESHTICAQCAALHKPVTQAEIDAAMERYWFSLEE